MAHVRCGAMQDCRYGRAPRRGWPCYGVSPWYHQNRS
jgi:hypothetical protein